MSREARFLTASTSIRLWLLYIFCCVETMSSLSLNIQCIKQPRACLYLNKYLLKILRALMQITCCFIFFNMWESLFLYFLQCLSILNLCYCNFSVSRNRLSCAAVIHNVKNLSELKIFVTCNPVPCFSLRAKQAPFGTSRILQEKRGVQEPGDSA